ncbi:MAG: hypothetical protein SNJ76_01360 [Fimbriimonadaceae bacterium]
MFGFREGDRVRIVARDVTEDDRKNNRYFSHMAGLTGTVQNIYAGDEIAVKIDLDALPPVAADVHRVATERMRAHLDISEEGKRLFEPEELAFTAHYMLLVQARDLEKA